jgi:glutaredoxin
MLVKIFWQEGCPHCPTVKNLGKDLENKGVKVEYYDIKSIDGLAEATFFNIMSTPSVVATSNNGTKTWKGKVPDTEELNSILFK